MLLAIVLLNLALVYMAVLFNDWNRLFYDALQEKNANVFWQQLGRFSYLAFAFIVIAVYKFYITQLLELRWRTWMTTHYLGRWLAHHAFYQLEMQRFDKQPATDTTDTTDTTATPATPATPATSANPDNPDQRIQEDLNQFTSLTINLSMGLLNALVTLASFVGILWALSGGFALQWGGVTYSIPGFMVWMALVYSAAGSLITHYVGRRQIALNFTQQKVEADFRHHLIRTREHSEAIALERGQVSEQAHLQQRFKSVIHNFLQLLQAQKQLVWFTSFFGQAAVIFPFLVAAPRYFSGAIQLGELMQISSAFGQVQGALSWFVDSFTSLAIWRATTDRLTSFDAKLREIENRVASSSPVLSQPSRGGANALHLHNFTLVLPTGRVLLANTQLHIAPGERVLLQGPSGSGKSSLFRTLAGLWPSSQVSIHLPREAMFIAQHSYFPQGPLRDALAYPHPPQRYTTLQLQQALRDALLPDLAHTLDTEAAWDQQLSGGEQQRLALARIFLNQPQWVFADEATSAIDPATQTHLYERLVTMVTQRGGGMVSIAHGDNLQRFHTKAWTFQPASAVAGPQFTLQETDLGSFAKSTLNQ